MKSKIAIYALGVCFLSVATFMCSFGSLGYAAIKIVRPGWTISPIEYAKLQSNDAYLRGQHTSPSGTDTASKNSDVSDQKLTKEELTEKRTAELRDVLIREKHEGMQTLLQSLIYSLLAVIMFVAHVLIVRRNGGDNA
ncbi:hypothetical protein [Serratia marcescens]|uniref:hypothetical protein n=1 Tax=Serratia marcescens TaxID=615 RepID=UPI0002B8A554|nr:hypothetical protein [Serratia marcescens]EMF07328.1 hypothetical protein F518_02802 [Serratia marcescens VGH107]